MQFSQLVRASWQFWPAVEMTSDVARCCKSCRHSVDSGSEGGKFWPQLLFTLVDSLSVQCALLIVQCALLSVNFSLFIHCLLCIVEGAVHSTSA